MKNKFYLQITRSHPAIVRVLGNPILQVAITRRVGDIYGFTKKSELKRYHKRVIADGGEAVELNRNIK